VKGEPLSPVNQYKARVIKLGNGRYTATMYMDTKFTEYQKNFIAEANKQVTLEQPYDGPVRVVAKFYFGTRRRKDLSNAGKLEFDALNGIVYEDDSQITEIKTEKIYSKENPGVEIKVYRHPESLF
jgi:Holliday junction resolvase RusA-like endonuclease